MFYDELNLGYFLMGVLISFAILIYFLLKIRSKQQDQDLHLDPESVWKTISGKSLKLNLSKMNMLYGVFQDASSTERSLVVKNVTDQILGKVNTQMGSRKKTVTLENEKYVIEYLMTWNQTAVLKSSNDDRILAKYMKTSLFGAHEIEVTGYGLIKAERPSIDFKVSFDYKKNEKIIGCSQKISLAREKGRIIVLPTDLPLAVRIFILSV